MSELSEFLLARIAEDEDEGRYWSCDCAMEGFPLRHGLRCAERVRADCETKLRIVELHGPVALGDGRLVCDVCSASGTWDPHPCDTLKLLALPYADHPHYRREWA